MKSAIVVGSVVAVVGFAGVASAAPDQCEASVVAPQWAPIEAAVGKAEALGYSVSATKRSKSCWKIKGHDRNGAEIEIHLDAAASNVVKSRDWRSPASR